MTVIGYALDGVMYVAAGIMLLSIIVFSIYNLISFITRDRRARKLLEHNPKEYMTDKEHKNVTRYMIKKGLIERPVKSVEEKYKFITNNLKEFMFLLLLISFVAFYFRNWILGIILLIVALFIYRLLKH